MGDGQSVMAAAEGQGIFWPTVCQGLAECHTCFFEVMEGAGYFEPPDGLEQVALQAPQLPRSEPPTKTSQPSESLLPSQSA